MEETKRFYSLKAISIATFFGGPLAAGYLVKKNYEALGQADNARKSLFIGIASTIVLFVIAYLIPDELSTKIGTLIPGLSAWMIYLIVEKLQGNELKLHKESEGKFYSGWKAAAVGSISMVIFLAGVAFTAVIAGDFLSTQHEYDVVSHRKGIEKFVANESKALAVYNHFETHHPEDIVDELKSGLVLWKENIGILNDINLIENLPIEAIEQNKKLLKYCDLRIQLNEILIKSFSEDTEEYVSLIESVGNEINMLLEELN